MAHEANYVEAHRSEVPTDWILGTIGGLLCAINKISISNVYTRLPQERTAAEAAASASRACCAAINTLRGSFRGMSQSMVPPTDSADASELSSSDCSSAHARGSVHIDSRKATYQILYSTPWIKPFSTLVKLRTKQAFVRLQDSQDVNAAVRDSTCSPHALEVDGFGHARRLGGLGQRRRRVQLPDGRVVARRRRRRDGAADAALLVAGRHHLQAPETPARWHEVPSAMNIRTSCHQLDPQSWVDRT